LKVFNPARAAKFPGRVCAHKKRCAAQAEYLRLAAQAYSPSDAMSQARNRSGPNEKGSTPPRDICRAVCRLKRRPCGGRSCQRGRGGPPDFPRHRRPRCIAPCGGVVWLRAPNAGLRGVCDFRRYCWRVGKGCRGGMCGRDGASGRPGCGGRDGSGVRPRLKCDVRR
jgi:hypothetical protein